MKRCCNVQNDVWNYIILYSGWTSHLISEESYAHGPYLKETIITASSAQEKQKIRQEMKLMGFYSWVLVILVSMLVLSLIYKQKNVVGILSPPSCTVICGYIFSSYCTVICWCIFSPYCTVISGYLISPYCTVICGCFIYPLLYSN